MTTTNHPAPAGLTFFQSLLLAAVTIAVSTVALGTLWLR
jgi:hypothetical protein